jgi:fructokinase
MSTKLYAAVETGGTKILCRVEDSDGETVASARWPTGHPDEVEKGIADFIQDALTGETTLAAIGIASFGPLVIDPASPDFGRMLDTPKPGWTGSNLRAAMAERFGVQVAIDTDVNAAAIAEQALGAGRSLASVAYVTVGTGIGGGLAHDGRALRGALHPEIGHLRLARHANDQAPSGCPFHHDCAEGLAAGPALALRLGAGGRLEDSPQVAALTAHYLGQLCAALVLAWSPQRIVIGGGVGSAPGMIPPMRAAMLESLGGYGVGDAVTGADFIVPAMLHDAGLEGAMLMARAMA